MAEGTETPVAERCWTRERSDRIPDDGITPANPGAGEPGNEPSPPYGETDWERVSGREPPTVLAGCYSVGEYHRAEPKSPIGLGTGTPPLVPATRFDSGDISGTDTISVTVRQNHRRRRG